MRNLRLLSHSLSSPIPSPASFEQAGFSCTSIDAERQVLFAVSDSGDLQEWDVNSEKLLSATPLGIDEPVGGRLAGIQFLQLDNAVCTAFSSGELIMCTLDDNSVECVGSLPNGIDTMVWSPDQEIFALVTTAAELLLMTREFDILHECPVEATEFGVAAPINLGWGKKETQFQGKAGKLANQPKLPTVEVPSDDQRARISWRGDGEYFVTSTTYEGIRKLRVWDRNAMLQSTSEKVDALEQSLAWRPSGNLIAATQRLPHRHDVVFFERNGLRHGEFTLPFERNEMEVLELAWNIESTVLAVWLKRLPINKCEESNDCKTYLQLWTSSNYHWYLKQEYIFGAGNTSPLSSFLWDPLDPNTIYAIESCGIVHKFFHSWAVDAIGGLSPTNPATVAVVDGTKLLLTHFRQECVPPPMASHTISLNNLTGKRTNVRHVSFMPVSKQDVSVATNTTLVFVAALTSDHRLLLLQIDTIEQESVLLGDFNIEGEICSKIDGLVPRISSVRQICWLSSSENRFQFLAIVGGMGQRKDSILSISAIRIEKGSNHEIDKIDMVELPDFAIRLQQNEELQSNCIAAVGLASGKILKVNAISSDGIATTWEGFDDSSSVVCSQLGIMAMLEAETGPDTACDIEMLDLSDCEGDDDNTDATEIVPDNRIYTLVALSDAGQLFINGRQLVANCNSFAIHDAFLIFTTHEHRCFFLRLSNGIDEAFKTYSNGGCPVREVERGSRIVSAVPRGIRLILQMPRGNLELIFPRPLLLVALKASLEKCAYRRAFGLARKHRLNLNLLCDFNLSEFEANITTFIRALASASSINLFIAELSDDDHSHYFVDETRKPTKTEGKRDKICNQIRESLLATDDSALTLSVVQTFLCKAQPEYDLMLEYIQKVRVKDHKLADSALNYAGVVLRDPELLYNAALGTYDFDLVVMVAQVLQKDPKEYLPFLDELSTYPIDERKYKIDLHLKRFAKALTNLSNAGDSHFETCQKLIIEHKLYKEGLTIYRERSPEQYTRVQSAAAANLKSLSKYRESGLMYNACGMYEEAIEAFQLGLEWKWAITVAEQVEMEASAKHSFYTGLATRLHGANKYEDAAFVAEKYLQDPELTVEYMILAKQWVEVLMLIKKHKRKDLIETHIKPAVVTEADAITQGFGDSEGSQLRLFKRHVERLTVVRAEKYARRIELMDPDFEDNPEADLFSETSSRASTKSRTSRGSSRSRSSRSSKGSKSSRNTAMTHRSRRREAAKKTSLREGGQFEEVALLEALRMIVARTESMAATIQSLCSVLYFLGMADKASEIEKTLTEIQDEIWKRFNDIWAVNSLMSSTVGPDGYKPSYSGPDSTANSRAAAFNYGGELPSGFDDPENQHPLEQLISTLSKVRVDEVEVDVPLTRPPMTAAERAAKPWESLYAPLLASNESIA